MLEYPTLGFDNEFHLQSGNTFLVSWLEGFFFEIFEFTTGTSFFEFFS
jgi:hypothetical protein